MRERPALALVACAALLFAPFWLFGQVFVPGDFLGFIYPWKEAGLPPVHNLELFDVTVFFYPQDVFLNARLKVGDLPLWNPHIFCGHPMVGSGQSALLYPPRLLAHLWLTPAVARTLIIAVHLLLDGLAMFLWLRGRGLLAWAACIGGLTWMLNGQVASWMEFEHVPVIAAYLPLMLWCLDRACEGRPRYWGLMAVAGALSLSGGHLQFNLYSAMVVGAYAAVRLRGPSQWLRLGLAGLLSLMLAAPTLLPFLELLGLSQRAVFTPQQIRETMAPTLGSLVGTLVCPDMWGNPARGFMLNRVRANLIYPEFACFLGLLPLGLALLACARVRSQRTWPGREVAMWAGLALLCLLFAAATPVYSLLLALIPTLKILIPCRVLLAFHFAGASLAALGAHSWLTEGPPRRLAAAITILMLGWSGLLGWIHWQLATAPERLLALPIKIPPADLGSAALIEAARHNYSSPQFVAPLVILGGLLALGSRRWGAVLAALAAIDLMLFASAFNTTVPARSLFPETPQCRFLARQAGLFRVDKRHAAFYNTLVPYGTYLLSGYESMFPRRVYDTLSAAEPGPLSMRSLSLQQFTSPMLDGFALRYLLIPPHERLEGGNWEPLGQGLYENRKALERAFVVGNYKVFAQTDEVYRAMARPEFSPREWVALESQPDGPVEATATGSKVEFVEYQPDRAVLAVNMLAPGLLVLSDTYYPGWEARVDGGLRPILAANGCCRAVHLEQGAHTVEFDYRPASLHSGIVLFAIALTILGAGWFISLWERESRKSALP